MMVISPYLLGRAYVCGCVYAHMNACERVHGRW